MVVIRTHRRKFPDRAVPPFWPFLVGQAATVDVSHSGLPEKVHILELIDCAIRERAVFAVFPARILYPHSAVIREESGRERPLFDHSADYLDPCLRLILSATDVVAVQPSVNGLLAAIQQCRQFVPVHSRMLRLSPQDILTAHGTPVPSNVLSLNLGHGLIREAENVSDVDDEEPSG